ncbi:MAG: hypothetical protein MAG431_02024 [Chloroflexi bacterium]|nr:hypothetical protein [Chloroflexota bacterium]
MKEKNQPTSGAFWQITFPLILGSILIAAVGIGAIIGNDIRQQADTSAIVLLVPFILLSLIPLSLLAIMAYGIIRLNNILPKYTQQAQELASQVEGKIKILANKIAEPVFRIESFWASLHVLFRQRPQD